MLPCSGRLGKETAVQAGTQLGFLALPHEHEEHEGRVCWPHRIELASFVLHVLKLEVKDLDQIKARLEEHLQRCHCGGGRGPRPQEGGMHG